MNDLLRNALTFIHTLTMKTVKYQYMHNNISINAVIYYYLITLK